MVAGAKVQRKNGKEEKMKKKLRKTNKFLNSF